VSLTVARRGLVSIHSICLVLARGCILLNLRAVRGSALAWPGTSLLFDHPSEGLARSHSSPASRGEDPDLRPYLMHPQDPTGPIYFVARLGSTCPPEWTQRGHPLIGGGKGPRRSPVNEYVDNSCPHCGPLTASMMGPDSPRPLSRASACAFVPASVNPPAMGTGPKDVRSSLPRRERAAPPSAPVTRAVFLAASRFMALRARLGAHQGVRPYHQRPANRLTHRLRQADDRAWRRSRRSDRAPRPRWMDGRGRRTRSSRRRPYVIRHRAKPTYNRARTRSSSFGKRALRGAAVSSRTSLTRPAARLDHRLGQGRPSRPSRPGPDRC